MASNRPGQSDGDVATEGSTTGRTSDYQTLSEDQGVENSTNDKPYQTLKIEESKPGVCFTKYGPVPLWMFVTFVFIIVVGAIIIGVVILVSQNTSSSTSLSQTDLWRDRSVYFLLTDRFACEPLEGTGPCSPTCDDLRSYCGGNYDGLRENLDYITEMGFDAIWINPIPENSDDPEAGPGYHGYYARNLSKLNPHFGNETALHNLIDEAHRMGVYVMLDVVANHMGPWSDPEPLDTFDPFNNLELHYHPQCDFVDQQKVAAAPGDYTHPGYDQDLFERCWLFGGPNGGGLPDLRTEDPAVAEVLTAWVQKTVAEYKFDAIRLDTVPYVSHAFWKSFTTASGVFSIGEISGNNYSFVASYQNEGSMTATLSYPSYFVYRSVFMSAPDVNRTSMTALSDAYHTDQEVFSDPYVVGTFIDNHDTQRAIDLTHNDTALVFNSLAYVWFLPGIPILYYGTEQGLEGLDENYTDQWGTCEGKEGGDPCNREDLWSSGYNRTNPFYLFVKQINLFRKATKASKYPYIELVANDTYYAYTRGPALVITTNIGNATSYQSFQIDLTPAEKTAALERQLAPDEAAPQVITWVGEELVNLFNTSDIITVPSSGIITVELIDGHPKIYHPRYAVAPAQLSLISFMSALVGSIFSFVKNIL